MFFNKIKKFFGRSTKSKNSHHNQEPKIQNNQPNVKEKPVKPLLIIDDDGRHETVYNMSHAKRGMAIIFNHEHFKIPGIEQRKGTNKDAYDLYNALSALRFEVRTHKDLTVNEIQGVIKDTAEVDYTDHDCLMIIVLSHGEQSGYIYASDELYKLEMLLRDFTNSKCPSLAGKPRLFFIQACQGGKLDKGKKIGTESDFMSPHDDYIPVHPDFLVALSTTPGYVSVRNQRDGSWFIQSLCHELTKNGKKEDLLQLLTFVCQKVAIEYESYNTEKKMLHGLKQVPCIMSMLRRILYFTDVRKYRKS